MIDVNLDFSGLQDIARDLQTLSKTENISGAWSFVNPNFAPYNKYVFPADLSINSFNFLPAALIVTGKQIGRAHV